MRTLIFAALAAGFATAPSITDVDRTTATQTFRTLMPALTKSSVEVLLPGALHELSHERIAAERPIITADGYRIDLVRASNCLNFPRISEACSYGSISATTIGAALTGRPFTIAIKSTKVVAHYFPVVCGGSCGSTHADFDYSGHRYRFAIKGGDVEKLRVMVSQIEPLRKR